MHAGLELFLSLLPQAPRAVGLQVCVTRPGSAVFFDEFLYVLALLRFSVRDVLGFKQCSFAILLSGKIYIDCSERVLSTPSG